MTPSLKALQALETTARTGSFVAAGRELSVTPAAVSQLVRSLERQIGRELFVRAGRGVVPSEAGREVLPRLHAVFEELATVSHQLAGTSMPTRLTVSVPPSIASGWLSRRIAGFVSMSRSLDISLRSDDDPVYFERDGIDIRMSYGRFDYRGQRTSEVLLDAIHPVCSPLFLERHGPFERPEALIEHPLVHTDWGPSAATFPSWDRWFESAGIAASERHLPRGLQVNSSKVAVDLASEGLGVALVQGLLAAAPLERGQLVVAFPHALTLAHPYCLTLFERGLDRDPTIRFDAWFRDECATSVARATRFAAIGGRSEAAGGASGRRRVNAAPLTAATLLGHNAVAMLPALCAQLARRTGLDVRCESGDGDRPSGESDAWRHELVWACGLASLRAIEAASGTPTRSVGRIVAAPVFTGESSAGYRSLLVVRRDSSIRTLAEVARARVAINERVSWSGCHALLEHLSANALAIDFRAVLGSGSHRRSLEAVGEGRADAAAIDDSVWRHLERTAPDLTRSLRVVARTSDWPAPPFLLGRGLDEERHDALLGALLALRPGEVPGLARVEACDERRYRPMFEAAERQAGIVRAWSLRPL